MDVDSIGPRVPFDIRPKDKYQNACVWWCYFLLGAGILCPWNAFITGVDYFSALWPDAHMDRLFTICYLPMCLLWLGIMIRFPRLAANQDRIATGFVGFIVVLLAVPLLDSLMIHSERPAPELTRLLVLLGVALVGFLDGISQGAIFGDASQLPPRFTHAVVSGTAASGSLICLLRIATKAGQRDSGGGGGAEEGADVAHLEVLRAGARLYMCLSALLCSCCLGVYLFVLPRLSLVQFYRSKAQAAGGRILEMGAIGAMAPPPAMHASRSDAYVLDEDEEEEDDDERRGAQENTSLLVSTNAWHDYSDDLVTPESLFQASSVLTAQREHSRSRTVLGATWPLALALFLTYAVTLSVFPGFLAEDIHSATLGSWYPILLITAFNLSDLAGKTVPHAAVARTQHALLAMVSCRALLIPAFALSAWLAAPTFVMAGLTIVLGFTNGLFTARAMTMTPLLVADSAADLAQNMMVFCLVAGLNVGAFAGWLWLFAPPAGR